MKLRSIALLSSLVVASVAAHAQSGAYAEFSAQMFNRSGIAAIPPVGSSNSDSPWLYGPTFGAYYTFHKIPRFGELKTGPINIGIDGRGDILRTNTPYSRSDAIVSLRITPKTPIYKITPYVQGGAGLGHTKVPGQANFTNNWNYQFSIGGDRPLKRQLSWQVVEFSGGFLGHYTAGQNANNSNYNLTLSTGIVYRFTGK